MVRGPDSLWGGDIRRFHPPAGVFDGVIGGPPCQAFSPLANLVRANGHEPRYGNLIPEFARVVTAAMPTWFLMENVPAAPLPDIPGYYIDAFMLDNAWLGEEQERKRRFTWGYGQAVSPAQFLELAALMQPGRSRAVTQNPVNNASEVKGRFRRGAVTSSDGGRFRRPAVTAAHAGAKRPKGWHLVRYRLDEAIRLQGLPEGVLSDSPFTAEGKLKAVANGVPLPMGRAIARAVRKAIAR